MPYRHLFFCNTITGLYDKDIFYPVSVIFGSLKIRPFAKLLRLGVTPVSDSKKEGAAMVRTVFTLSTGQCLSDISRNKW